MLERIITIIAGIAFAIAVPWFWLGFFSVWYALAVTVVFGPAGWFATIPREQGGNLPAGWTRGF